MRLSVLVHAIVGVVGAAAIAGCSSEDDPLPSGAGSTAVGGSAAGGSTAGGGGEAGTAGSGGGGGSGAEFPSSQYEIPVEVPDCDTADPSVRLVQTEADWDDINDAAYRVFCVAPGDYRGIGNLYLDADGTSAAPRYVRYYDPSQPTDERHPVQQAASERAIIATVVFADASYWVFDRLTVTGDWEVVRFDAGSEHNVLNRVLVETSAVMVRHGAHDNTVQNSVLRNAPKVPGGDRVCMVLSGSNNDNDVVIHGTRIVNNEIYDCTDGIQAWRVGGSTHPIDFGGTIIDQNDIYLTDGMYTDCNGNLDPQGDCACAENAIDLKAAGTDSTNYLQVSNNRMWGFKPTDTACGGTGSGGAASVVHMTANYTLYQGNIIWNVPRAMTFLNDHHSAIDNVIWNVHRNDEGTAIYPDGPNCEIYRNVIIDVERWAAAYGDNGDYRCNTLIAAGRRTAAGANIQADYNFYYDADQMTLPGDHDIVRDQASDAEHTDLCFPVRRWTGPEEVCIPNGSPTAASPHAAADACDPQLGARPDVGVHDELW